MKLTKTFERLSNGQLQVIELSCNINKRNDIDELGYDDFVANLFIAGKLIADISPVLSNVGCFTEMVDSVDWHQLYIEMNPHLEIAY